MIEFTCGKCQELHIEQELTLDKCKSKLALIKDIVDRIQDPYASDEELLIAISMVLEND